MYLFKLVVGVCFGVTCLININSCGKKPTAEDGVIKLRWCTDQNPVREEQIKLFEQTNPGIKIEWDWAAAGLEKILTQIAGGTPPDLFDIYSPEQFYIFAQKNVLYDVTDLCKQYKVDLTDFWPQCKPYMYYQDKVYAFPTNAATIVLFYNKKLFTEKKVSFPTASWTWDNLLTAAKQLTEIDEKTNQNKYFGFSENFLDVVLPWQYGADFYTPDGKQCIINSAAGKQAYRFLYDLRVEHKVIPTPLQYELLASAGGWGVGPMNSFAMGRIAMIAQGRWSIITYRKYPDLDWDIAPLPRGKEKATLFLSRSTAIARNTKHPAAAFKFLQFLTTTEYNKHISKVGDSFPARKSIAYSDLFLYDPSFPKEKNNKLYLDVLDYARVPHISPYVSQLRVDEIMKRERDLMWDKQQTPEQTLDNIAKKVNLLIAEGLVADTKK